jgi:glycosyltransferase involved in cell wall biosynthesis
MPTPEPDLSLRVLLLSAVGTNTNPYLGLLRDGLTAAGAHVCLASRLDAAVMAAFRPDVIHLHWLERYDLPPAVTVAGLRGARDLPRRALRRVIETTGETAMVYAFRRRARLRRLFRQLRSFQAGGGRVAYTVHNLDPHEDAGAVERWGTAQMVGLADVVHVHDIGTAELVAARFGRRQGVVVLAHGHYLGSYPNTIGRAAARTALALPADAFVFVCLGLLRPYKGLEELLPAFRALPRRDLRLVLAGKPGSAGYLDVLQTLAAGDDRIRLVPRFIPREDVQIYQNAADVGVFPYRQITTSGAALLAFSFGLPVLAPALGAFPHLVAGRRGYLYDPAEPDALALALDRASRTDWTGAREEIMGWVAQFDWAAIGGKLVAAYRT